MALATPSRVSHSWHDLRLRRQLVQHPARHGIEELDLRPGNGDGGADSRKCCSRDRQRSNNLVWQLES
jgi:hypothetical protein